MTTTSYAVLNDITPNRATVVSLHDDRDDAAEACRIAGDQTAKIGRVAADVNVGERVWLEEVDLLA